jgi:SnoaL-like polyketide cyclase
MKSFLLIGLDPYGIDYTAPNVPKGMTAEKLSAAVADAQKQFSAQGDRLDNCIIKMDGSAEAPVTAQLARSTYDAVLIGGGLRQPDANMELLERIVDSIHVHAPGAPIGFVALPDGSVDAAARALSRRDTQPTGSSRAAHILALMSKGDDAFNARDVAAMKRTHHPDMTAHLTGSEKPVCGEPAHAAAMREMLSIFPDTRVHNDPYTVQFGSDNWSAVICRATGTFTGEMTLPDGTKVAPTGKSYDVNLCTIAKWDGDLLREEYVFWDSALQANQLGLSPG